MSKLLLLVVLILYEQISCLTVLPSGENDLETSTGGLVSNYVPFYPVQEIPRGMLNPVYGVPKPSIAVVPPAPKININKLVARAYNPLLGALLVAESLGIPDKPIGYNHPELLPPNPYVALLLSHYGHYIAIPGLGRGLYGYGAVNNYHNNKPFGAYKIYEDNDS